MNAQQKVINDITSLPYRDVSGRKIEPGRLVVPARLEGDYPIGQIKIVKGELCVDSVPIDDVLECTPLLIIGWVH